MQIKNLVEVVEETLPDVTHPTEVFAVFDLFVMTDNEQGLEWCWEVSWAQKLHLFYFNL